MTDFDRIKEYYKYFNEDERLTNDNSGRLEFEMTMKIIQKYLPGSATILDLGGATGAHTFPLAEKGYKMYLADLSETLISQARNKLSKNPNKNIVSCDVVNATNLSIYDNEQFDVVLLFGPLYHLLEKQEREKCLKEVNRVLKSNGIVFTSFIPYLSGSIGIIDRYFRTPEQVNKGFQEGYFPSSNEIEELFNKHGFNKITISSIRGFAYEKENKLYNIQDKEMFNEIIKLIEKTSELKEIIETCGHALYIGSKK